MQSIKDILKQTRYEIMRDRDYLVQQLKRKNLSKALRAKYEARLPWMEGRLIEIDHISGLLWIAGYFDGGKMELNQEYGKCVQSIIEDD